MHPAIQVTFWLFVTLATLFSSAIFSTVALAQTTSNASINNLLTQPFVGDLSEIRKRRTLRVLVSHNRTNFFDTKKGKRGLEHDLIIAYESYLNRGPRKERYKTHVVFLAHPFDQLFSELLAGRGDIIASGLTITPERSGFSDFTKPYIKNVNEVLISGKNAMKIERLEDLSGKTVVVVADSSHLAHIRVFNQFLGLYSLPPIDIIQADPIFESEDILEMINAGVYDYTVVDDHIAHIYQSILPNIKIQEEIVFHYGGEIAWAINQDLPNLKKSLDDFIQSYAKPGRLLGNSVYKKYFKSAYWIQQGNLISEMEGTPCLSHYFQLYSEFYEFDWYLIAAQAYQESRFNQKLTSHAGATGIMQIKPSTASSKNVGIKNIKLLENNIHAGVKYLSVLRDLYFSGDQYSPVDQINFSLAAYNAGPGRVRSMQKKALQMGLDPNVWFYNVETVARNTIGHETVDYVAKIQKTKIALKTYDTLVRQRQHAKQEAFQQAKLLSTLDEMDELDKLEALKDIDSKTVKDSK